MYINRVAPKESIPTLLSQFSSKLEALIVVYIRGGGWGEVNLGKSNLLILILEGGFPCWVGQLDLRALDFLSIRRSLTLLGSLLLLHWPESYVLKSGWETLIAVPILSLTICWAIFSVCSFVKLRDWQRLQIFKIKLLASLAFWFQTYESFWSCLVEGIIEPPEAGPIGILQAVRPFELAFSISGL